MNMHIARAQIEQIAEQIAPMCDGDEQLLSDMLEGETDLLSLVQRLHENRARDLEMLEGIKSRKDRLKAREDRIKAREARWKEEIGKLLRAAKLPKLELPEITYSVRCGKPKLVVADKQAVPESLSSVSWSPDMAKIKAQFSEEDELPNWLVREPAKDVVTGRAR